MDYSLNADQEHLVGTVRRVVDKRGLSEARRISGTFGYDEVLDEQLAQEVDLADQSLLDRTLVAHVLAELGTSTTFGLRAVLGTDVDLPSGPLAVALADRKGPVRYGSDAQWLLKVGADGADLIELTSTSVEPVASGLGFSYARFDRSLPTESRHVENSDRLVELFKLALSAELAGYAQSAIVQVREHLKSRVVFGKPLSFLQALRHRVAEVSVTAEATTWLVRHAAHSRDAHAIHQAAFYAAACGAELAPELVQLVGARGFAEGFGIEPFFTMRLDAIRAELGGRDRLARETLQHTESAWAAAAPSR